MVTGISCSCPFSANFCGLLEKPMDITNIECLLMYIGIYKYTATAKNGNKESNVPTVRLRILQKMTILNLEFKVTQKCMLGCLKS
jgi:hypothetical protein